MAGHQQQHGGYPLQPQQFQQNVNPMMPQFQQQYGNPLQTQQFQQTVNPMMPPKF